MSVYISGLLLTYFLLLFESRRKSRNRKIICGNRVIGYTPDLLKWLPAIPLTVIAAIRYNVGYDYSMTYVNIFNNVLNGRSKEAWGDYGYILLNKVVLIFTKDYAGIFIVTAIIFCGCMFLAIYRESDDIAMSGYLLVCTGYYFNFLNGMRQMLALAILMVSIKFIRENKFKKFMICVFIACLFHFSALTFIPAYFIRKVNINKVSRFIIVVSVYASSRVLAVLIQKLVMATKYGWYFTEKYVTQREGYVATLMSIAILVFVCLLEDDNENNKLYIDLQMIAVCIQAFVGIIPQINRIGWYYGVSVIFLLPNVLTDKKKRNNKNMYTFIRVCVYILYFIYFIYTIGVNNSNMVLPYQTIFSR